MQRAPRFSTPQLLLLFSLDVAIALVSYVSPFLLRAHFRFGIFQDLMPLPRFAQVTHYFPILVVTQITLIYFFGLYDRYTVIRRIGLPVNLFKIVATQVLVLAAVYYFTEQRFPRSVFPLFWLFNCGLLYLWRSLAGKRFVPRTTRKVLVVGTNQAARTLLEEIERLPSYGFEVVGIIDNGDHHTVETEKHRYPILGRREDILDIASAYSVDEIILTSTGSWQERLITEISRLQEVPARVLVIPSAYEIMIGRISHLRIYDIPLLEVVREPQNSISRFRKRCTDLVLASSVLILCLPLFPVLILMVKLTSRGPFLFIQERVGKDRIRFPLYKIRTMIEDAEEETGPVLSRQGDPRLTPVGDFLRRYRLDELPQLWNVIRGDMSFVGPRPERACFSQQFDTTIPGYGERFRVKPGITGLAQVNGGYATTPQIKLKYDLAYIYNPSFWLDLRILGETIRVIMSGQGTA